MAVTGIPKLIGFWWRRVRTELRRPRTAELSKLNTTLCGRKSPVRSILLNSNHVRIANPTACNERRVYDTGPASDRGFPESVCSRPGAPFYGAACFP
jgi:hypothetical protein